MSDPTKHRRRSAETRLAEALRAAYGPLLSEPIPSALAEAGRKFADRLNGLEQAGFSPVATAGGGGMDSALANLDERIRERAYRLWIEEGQPEGRADRHWAAATALVQDEVAAAANESAPVGADPAAMAASVRIDREKPASD